MSSQNATFQKVNHKKISPNESTRSHPIAWFLPSPPKTHDRSMNFNSLNVDL